MIIKYNQNDEINKTTTDVFHKCMKLAQLQYGSDTELVNTYIDTRMEVNLCVSNNCLQICYQNKPQDANENPKSRQCNGFFVQENHVAYATLP